MRIAFITFEYPPFIQGGAGVYAENVTKELAKLDHEVHVFTPHTTENEQYNTEQNIIIHRIKFINKPFLSAPSFWVNLRIQFKKIEKQVGGFDILHGNQSTDFFLTNNNIPHVVTIHSLSSTNLNAENPNIIKRITERGENNFINNYIEKCIIKRADLIIANSEYTKRSILSAYGYSNINRIKVGYPGLSINRPFSLQESEEKKIRTFLNVDKKPIVLFVGRLVLRKGLHFLLPAFKVLLDQNIQAKLIVVGNGPKKRSYLKQVRDLNLSKDVVFTGLIDDSTLKKIYYLSDVVAIPSLNEPFGIVVLEAMAAKKPIVASNSGGIPEIIQNGINGQLIDPQDHSEFANAMKLYLEDKELSNQIGECNFKKVTEKFSWSKSAIQILEVYKMLLE